MIAAAVIGASLLVAGCSTDSMFPAVHDMPAARTETTLTPDQVKQATDSLVSEREHLNTETQQNQGQPASTAQSAAAAKPPLSLAATTGSIPQKPKKKPTKTAQSAARQQTAEPGAQQQQQYTSGVSAYAKQ